MGVTLHNVVGFDRATIDKAMELADQHPEIYLTLGWHPTEAGTYDEEVENYLLKALQHPKVIALGEIGLDYYWMTADKEIQARVFKRQMELAKQLDLPFVVHTRDALEDTYQIIKEVGVGPRGGIMHSFSGTLEEAQAFMDLGMHISFSGVVTFKKAVELQEAAQALPLEKSWSKRTHLPGACSQAWSGKSHRLHQICGGYAGPASQPVGRRSGGCDLRECKEFVQN